MSYFPRNQRRRQARWYSAAVHRWMAVTFLALFMWAFEPAVAQSPPQQPYSIAVGDKIGVTVVGQPDLSGESTVDRSGNLRMPILGNIRAVDLTLDELEKSIGRSLEQGYVRRPMVNARIVEFLPVYVLGMVRTPGPYSYRDGLSVLGAIARAGGVGPSIGQTGTDPYVAEERVRLLEISRVTLLARRARLLAQQRGDDHIEFPEMSGLVVDPARVAQIRDGEQRVFVAEREAEQREIETLQKQLPRLQAEIQSLKQQMDLEGHQRELNKQLIVDYEQLAKSGLARKPNFIEVKREEARIDENVARLQSESLRADLAIGDLHFRITELHNVYQRRVMTELREAERALMELSVTLPSAQRAFAANAQQIIWLNADQAQRPAITVVRTRGGTIEKHDVSVDFLLQPGDVVQVGALFPPTLEPDRSGAARERTAESAVR